MFSSGKINPIAYLLGWICPPLADYVDEKMAESKKFRDLEYEKQRLLIAKMRKEMDDEV